MGLTRYKSKRDFSKTPEPRGKRAKQAGGLRFVVQKHDASRLHYDFRLEMDGTLKSWAVPKGFPWKQGEKRLAVEVEDHPIEYGDFEGVIPKGQYGGGTVMLWDRGTYQSLGGEPTKDLRKGKFHFVLSGTKLKGEWTLVKFHGAEEENQWLLLKSGKNARPVSKKSDDQSVLSKRTMAQIAKARDAEWTSHRPSASSRSKSASATATPPRFVAPMKAKLADAPPAGDWIYELKFDGYRAIAIKDGDEVQLWSRNEKDLARKFGVVAKAMGKVPADRAVIDGEIVALDPEGRPSFQLLQAYEKNEQQPPLCYYVFDLLNLDGRDLRALPLEQRKQLLEQLVRGAEDTIRYSAALPGEPARILAEIAKRGLEGLIGKQANSKYESGRRTGAWIKLKCLNEQEFVIGGYTPPKGSRSFFGAILVGYHEGGKLRFAAKVGTGFNEKRLREMHRLFQPLRRPEPPFDQASLVRESGFAKSELKRCTWLESGLICQVRFTEWTRDGGLRHPVFIGLRDDKSAAQVVRERAA